ncbi:hypothetical protein KP509_33G030600 [Ceratopteris richardii]|uniref:Phosphoglycerate mutase n=1 Tax=Ceratopteris richardii TaxID=49495 RepID=A0A8T2QPC8_CERRI|nr:hypothetical protein KP509_33G030600 [Ceratopteris richardii]
MELKNQYWVLRHGRSKPNERGLIVSHLSNGVLEEHALSSEGVKQAQEAGYQLIKELAIINFPLEKVRIYCSPFSRTVDTAKAVAEVLKINPSQIQYSEHLRERYFGPDLELKSHEHYPEIWALDEYDSLVGPAGGESVADVAARLAKIIEQIETDCQGSTPDEAVQMYLSSLRFAVVVVSHGDPLQIFQTIIKAAVSGVANYLRDGANYDHLVLSKHRTYALQTGELRRIP